MGTQTTYFEVTLHVGIAFRVDLRLSKSPMDYFKMNLHASITYKLLFSLKGHPNYILIISKWPDMWVLHFGLGRHLRLPKSPKGYIKTNLNMGIAYRETQKNIYLLPFGNISKLSSFTFFKKCKRTLHCFTYVQALKLPPKMHPKFILIIIDL